MRMKTHGLWQKYQAAMIESVETEIRFTAKNDGEKKHVEIKMMPKFKYGFRCGN